jgi:hypothetical protein
MKRYHFIICPAQATVVYSPGRAQHGSYLAAIFEIKLQLQVASKACRFFLDKQAGQVQFTFLVL